MTKLNKDKAGKEKMFTWNHINFKAAVTASTHVAHPSFTTTSLQQHRTSFVPAKHRNVCAAYDKWLPLCPHVRRAAEQGPSENPTLC